MHSPQFSGLRWTRLCVASTATALFASTAALSASATQTHALRSGESLDTLARKYHVSVQDLIDANKIDDQNRIPNGRLLTIPAPPKSLVVATTMHGSAHITKNKVSVRLGPGLDYRRAQYAYEGDLVTVTAEQDGWMQVALDNGHTGWVLNSLVALSKHNPVDEVAKGHRQPANGSNLPHKGIHDAPMVAVEEDRTKARKVARRRVSDATGTRKQQSEEQHPTKAVAHSGRAGKPSHAKATKIAKATHESGKSRKANHKHEAEIALSSHRRKTKSAKTTRSHSELASARRHSSGEVRRLTKSSSRRRHTQVADSSGQGSNDLVRTAYAYRGTPYVWGGERPGGFDCSGLTKHLYAKKGIDLPHSARAQFEMGHKVDRHGLKPGDLVFFHTVTPGISHVGMYVGNGNFVHASSRRTGVRVDSLDSSYYSKAYRGARRMK